MRVLTVRQPWAWAIIAGGKDVENRVRNLAGDYRGPLAIHAGKVWDGTSFEKPEVVAAHTRLRDTVDGLSLPERELYQMDPGRGHIIGVVNLRATHHSEFCTEADEHGELCSAWAEPDVWHLELEDPQTLTQPISFKGALGMRTLPADVIAAIQLQLDNTLKGVTRA